MGIGGVACETRENFVKFLNVGIGRGNGTWETDHEVVSTIIQLSVAPREACPRSTGTLTRSVSLLFLIVMWHQMVVFQIAKYRLNAAGEYKRRMSAHEENYKVGKIIFDFRRRSFYR